jgi:hypothetical protein
MRRGGLCALLLLIACSERESPIPRDAQDPQTQPDGGAQRDASDAGDPSDAGVREDAAALLDATALDADRSETGAGPADVDGGADAGEPLDATAPPDAGPPPDSGPRSDGGALPAPRPTAPLSSATVTSQRPTLRWALGPGIDGAEITLCRDRALTIDCRNEIATGDRARPASALSPGWWFWQLRGVRSGSTGTITGPVWQLWVGVRDAPIDTSWGTSSDFNGDGYADVVVGAPVAAGGDGRLYVYHGGPSGSPAAASQILLGSGFGQLGYSTASAGDVDGDGYADLIVGSPLASPGGRRWAGTASVFLGGPSGLSATAARTLEGGEAGDQFGNSVSSAGDVDGDGYADVVVGAHAASPGGRVAAGIASIFHGSAAGTSAIPARTLAGSGMIDMFGFANDQFGFSVASAGDVNGDGYADLVIGAHSADPNGTASVFHGGPSGIPAIAARTLEGTMRLSFFGESVDCAGDVNGDGYADIVIGAHWTEVGGRAQAGTASVFHGGAGGVGASPNLVLAGAASRDFFGNAVAGAGDVNADGFGDVVVGASESSPAGRARAGQATVFFGSAGGLSTAGAQTYQGATAGDTLGSSVGGGGDVDGDGFADLIIGAASASPGGRTYAGAAMVFLGGSAGTQSAPARTYEGGAADDYFGAAVAWAPAGAGAPWWAPVAL